MSIPRSPQRGTVADRIRAFQDVQQPGPRAPASRVPPRAPAETNEDAPTSSRGQRKESNIAQPIRTPTTKFESQSVQGSEWPTHTVHLEQNRFAADRSEQNIRKELSTARPLMSMEKLATEQSITQEPNVGLGRRLSRKNRSMENVADGSSELAVARSRLRSIIDDKMAKGNPPRSRALTIAELNHMLDDAIEGNADMDELFSGSVTGEETPKVSVLQRPQTALATPRLSFSRERVVRSSINSVRPRSSGESNEDGYDDEKNALYWPHLAKPPAKPKRPQYGHSAQPSASARTLPKSVVDPNQPGSIEPTTQLSPVRQRAAMFENLGNTTSVHSEDCADFQHHRPDVHAAKPKAVSARKIHKIKFGDTIQERPGTPLIPLTLPQIVIPRETSSRQSQRTVQEHDGPDEEKSCDNDSSKQDGLRKPSLSWPFRWGIFNKSSPSHPESTEKAMVDDEPVNEQRPAPPAYKSSVVKTRVQDLLQAAKERETAEKKKWESERQRIARRHSRIPSAVAKESKIIEDHVDLQNIQPSQLPPLQVPLQEQKEDLQVSPAPPDEEWEPRTPLQRAMTEKQVFSPLRLREAPADATGSPRKSSPPTPLRGRTRKSIHHLSMDDQERGVEQRFNLSPRPTRNPSGHAGGGVKVEVEVRDSPEREARERGEKIVIIRANVKSLE